MAIRIAQGPSVDTLSKADAIKKLRAQPGIEKDAEVSVEEIDGRWIAAVHTAEGNPFGAPSGGGPADSDEEAPSPKDGGGDDKEPSEGGDDDGPPSDDGGPDGPPGAEDGKEKGKGGLEHEIFDLLQKIVVALGIPDQDPSEGPVPGADGPPAPPGPGGPPGAGGPPGGPEETIKHERSLKPGEAPPGTTPVGAPSFAHVLASHPIKPHPWAEIMGRKATFNVEEQVPPTHTASAVDHELQQLAHGTGYRVAQIHVANEDGRRIARAQITIH